MIALTELLALPFEEARVKIDALTHRERETLALEATDWLVERLKEIIREVT